ncbi:MAG: AAA family ATPase [Oscillospiraceae bacterium]
MENKIICIGRQFGSGGHEIGVRAAAALGIRIYERELVTLACKYGEIAEKTLEGSDEKATNPYLFQAVYEGNYHVIRGLPTSEVLFSLQRHEIRRVARRESCIFVGRCADYVLREEPVRLLRVFVSAPLENRVRRKMEQEQLSREKALRLVRKMDKQRKKYYDSYTGQIWGDPENYDLNIDSSLTGIEGAVELVLRRYEEL